MCLFFLSYGLGLFFSSLLPPRVSKVSTLGARERGISGLRLGRFTLHIAESFLEGSGVGLFCPWCNKAKLLDFYLCSVVCCVLVATLKNLGITWRLWTLTVMPYIMLPCSFCFCSSSSACCSIIPIPVCDVHFYHESVVVWPDHVLYKLQSVDAELQFGLRC